MKRIYSFIIFALLLAVSFTQTASAYDLFKQTCDHAPASSSVCSSAGSKKNPISGSDSAIVQATHIVAIIAVVAAVIILIWAGIRFITSEGEADKAAAARKTAINALIGLVFIVLAQALIGYTVTHFIK